MKLEDFSKARLSEIADLVIWGLIEDDKESAIEYLREECDMSKEELEWFGVEIEEEDE